MATITRNGITATDSNTDLAVTGAGTGVPDLESGTKLNGITFRGKGGDIASASPLVIDTDGDMFDVTGTTGFSAMTVAANRAFTLQWDGIVTVTHGASLVLPGGADLTTAAGDVWTCYSTAANTVIVTNVATAATASSAGAWQWISTATASASSTIEVTGIDSSTYKTYLIIGEDLVVGTDSAVIYCRVGTSGSILTATNYSYVVSEGGSTAYAAQASTSANHGRIAANTGNATGEGFGFHLTLDGVAGARWPLWRGVANKNGTGGNNAGGHVHGSFHNGTNVITRFQIYPTTGTLTSGDMHLFGLVTS